MNLFLLLAGGVCLGLMTSLNGQLASYLSSFEISFLVHAIGAVLLAGYILVSKKERFCLNGGPAYIYFVGFLGVALVTSASVCANQIGATLTMALSIAGQLISSAVIDHFGLFRLPVVRFRLKRIPSYLMIGAGLLLILHR